MLLPAVTAKSISDRVVRAGLPHSTSTLPVGLAVVSVSVPERAKAPDEAVPQLVTTSMSMVAEKAPVIRLGEP